MLYDAESLSSLKQSIADHLRGQGRRVPSDDELNDSALSLLNYFDLLITSVEKIEIEENRNIR